MQLARTHQQFAADRIQMPLVFDLIEETDRQVRHPMRLFDIHHKPALDIAQRMVANVLIDGQMQHAVDQTFPQRTARKGHALNIQLGENGNQDRQAAGEDQGTFKGKPFDFELFQTTTVDGALL